jgi:hypothetical protein
MDNCPIPIRSVTDDQQTAIRDCRDHFIDRRVEGLERDKTTPKRGPEDID